ncbi:MAG TPA: DUF930 domain-containing protein [Hyphomicrobiaceae bacterium]|nr:DUF930 domain-containing protein [Hyphomicrobiaceae bacterium]
MLGRIALGATLLFCVSQASLASSLDQALSRLDPEERSHQACILRGLDTVRREPRLRNADRMKTSISVPAVLEGTVLTAKGGAVRAGQHWYQLSFTCHLTKDLMKATSFSFVLGREIPKEAWDRQGLWQ